MSARNSSIRRKMFLAKKAKEVAAQEQMKMYNVTTVGGEILNLDGALELDAANKLASEIEAEHDIEVRVVEQDEVDECSTQLGCE